MDTLTIHVRFSKWRITVIQLALWASYPFLWVLCRARVLTVDQIVAVFSDTAARFIVAGCKYECK